LNQAGDLPGECPNVQIDADLATAIYSAQLEEEVMRAGTLLRLGAASLLVVLVGCTTAEVRSASAAVEAARAAGKDKECPSEFEAAESLVSRAKALCNS
jgi:hypothetical protein